MEKNESKNRQDYSDYYEKHIPILEAFCKNTVQIIACAVRARFTTFSMLQKKQHFLKLSYIFSSL